ncbi:MAG: hypothetical protein J5877_01050 [Clostridia bacterium]|nr:hypothetical protein [Clostridia bacterium]
MKKTMAIILAIIMIVSVSLVFTGCNSNSIKQFLSGKEPESIEDSDNGGEKEFTLDGGWTKAESPEITDEFLKVFGKATETLAGAELKPVAYIASQVVAGVNHLVLCRQTATVPDAKPTYALVCIYQEPDGNSSITSIVDSEIPAAEEGVGIPGGWTKTESPVITDEIKKKIESAFKELTGAEITPLALLEQQTAFADGVNYCLLCESVATVPDAQAEYEIVYVTAYKDGKAEITDIKSFETAEEENAEIPNPVVGYQTLEDAEKAVGFNIEYKGIDRVINYSVISNEILEISFKGGYMRKAKGRTDISGDYNVYKEEITPEINGNTVTLRGVGKLYYLALWTDGDFTYCLGLENGASESEITNLVKGIK